MQANTETKKIKLNNGEMWNVSLCRDGTFAWCINQDGTGFSCSLSSIRGELKREIIRAFQPSPIEALIALGY